MNWLRLTDRRRFDLLKRAPAGPLLEHLKKPWPRRSLDVNDVALVAVDLETTGLDPRRDEIVSAGWVKIDNGRVALASARRETIPPKGPLHSSSVVIHGISHDSAARGTALQVVLKELLAALSGAVLVAHHAPLDAAFLSSACLRCYGAPWAGPAIDTLGQNRDPTSSPAAADSAGCVAIEQCSEELRAAPLPRARRAR